MNRKQKIGLGLLYNGATHGATHRATHRATILILYINTIINTIYKLTSKKIRCSLLFKNLLKTLYSVLSPGRVLSPGAGYASPGF